MARQKFFNQTQDGPTLLGFKSQGFIDYPMNENGLLKITLAVFLTLSKAIQGETKDQIKENQIKDDQINNVQLEMEEDEMKDSEEDKVMTEGIMGYIAGNRFFIMKENIPQPEKELKYTFIVVKHAMVVPEVTKAKTYPNDPLYKNEWKPGHVTQRGRSLMLMVGRSLKNRYNEFLKNTASWDHTTVSSMNKKYAQKLTAQLGYGLFSEADRAKHLIGTDLSTLVQTDQNYEKMEMLLPMSVKCNWMKILYNTFQTKIKAGHIHLTTCTKNLYKTLQNIIKVVNNDDKEWVIHSAEKVYKLWSMLVFEIVQGQKEPAWANDKWSRIQSCVFEWYRKLLTYHPAIPALASGRMIHQMEQELNGEHKFHVHVTDDIGALSMNWTLPNSERNYWPDPGDAVLFDFFTDNTVQVSSFSGWQRMFDKIYESPREEFFQEYKKRNIHISEEDWNVVCDYDGIAEPPENIDASLFQHPMKHDDTMKDKESLSSSEDGDNHYKKGKDSIKSIAAKDNKTHDTTLKQDESLSSSEGDESHDEKDEDVNISDTA